MPKTENKFGLKQADYLWIKKIFSIYLPDTKVKVFGSRSRGDQKQYSDLDLALDSTHPIPKKTLLEIQEQFSNSSIPIKIDLIELQKIESAFRTAIQDELKEF